MQRVLIRKATRWMSALWSLGLVLPLACLAAYLPISGPPQLRFQAPRTNRAITPPPLALPAAPQAVVEEQTFQMTNHSPCVAETLVLTAKSPTLCENNGVTENPAMFTGGAEFLVTPQMMVPYFQHGPGTNAPGPNFSAPVYFKPPVPMMRPPSRSAYSSPSP